MDPRISEQFPEQLQRRFLVATLLDQDVQHLAFVINRAPQIPAPDTDLHDHPVPMPTTGRRASARAKIGGDRRPKPETS